MRQLIRSKKIPENDKIQQVIAIILQHKGLIKVQSLLEQFVYN